MREISAEALVSDLDDALAELARLPGGSKPLVAFDADGTLWTGDVGDDFFEAFVEERAIRSPAAEAVLEEARSLAPATAISSGDACAAAGAVLAAFHEHRYPEERFYELVAWLGAGYSRAELAAYADRMLAARGLDARLHGEIAPVLRWARARAVEVFVVSASPRIVVQRGVARVGIDPDHVLAAEAEFDGERMLPNARRPIPYGAGKVTALRSAVGDRPLLAAFGDNVFDVAMLREARVPVAIRPKDRLVARASEIHDLRRLLSA